MPINVSHRRRIDRINLNVRSVLLGYLLQTLGGTFNASEDIAQGATIGTLTNTTSGSTLTLIDDAGGRVALSGINVVRGTTGLDYEGDLTHNFTVEESYNGETRQTVLVLTVSNVLEVTLNALGGSFSLAEDAAAAAVAGGLTGTTAGATLTLIDDAGGRVALSGTNIVRGATSLDYETATSHSFTVRETHADGSNSPRDTILSLAITNVADAASLGNLTGTFSLAEDAAQDTVAGSLSGKTTGSTLSILDDAGGRVALSGTSIVRGATALDYETATSHNFTVRETLADSPNSPNDTVFSLTVTNVNEQPSLVALSLSATTIEQNVPVTISIIGATAGSTLSVDTLPAGLTLNSGARTISGTPTALATTNFNLTETLADSDNSPLQTALSITVEETGPGELDETITPPTLSLAVTYNTYPPEFYAELDVTVQVGDKVQLEWSDDIRFDTIVGSAENVIDDAEATAQEATFTGLSAITSPAVYYFRARIVQPDNDYSAWSNIVMHGAEVDSTPAAFSFTDVTNATLSTVYESNTITLSGFNQPVTISVTGGEYAVDDGSGFGAYTSSAGTVYPGDQVKVRHTSSGSNSTATNTVLTVGGVSDTYTTSTVAGAVSLPSSGLILQLDADDLSTLFQTVDGSTTPVSGDAQPVGYWADKSGNGFHLSAAANDTTRPTYNANGGLPFVQFDGTNDVLRRLAALGLYNGGACTVIAALKSNAATSPGNNLPIFMEGNSASANAVYAMGSSSGNDDIIAFIRNDANSTYSYTPSGSIALSGLGAVDAVFALTDNGSSLQGYIDGATSGGARAYTRSGTLTLNRFALAALVRNSVSSWLGYKLYAIAAWNRVLNSTELAEATTYMASKQGRSL